MWKQCSEGQSGSGCADGHAKEFSKSQLHRQEDIVNYNGGGFAGYSDWRVPNIAELTTILEKRCDNPAVNEAIFPKTRGPLFGNGGYWSSSRTRWSSFFWSVDFSDGSFDERRDVNYIKAYLRLVRG